MMHSRGYVPHATPGLQCSSTTVRPAPDGAGRVQRALVDERGRKRYCGSAWS